MFSFCFARELHALDAPDFDAEIERSMHDAVPAIPTFKHFPILKAIVGMMPTSVLTSIQPALKGYLNMRGVCRAFVIMVALPD